MSMQDNNLLKTYSVTVRNKYTGDPVPNCNVIFNATTGHHRGAAGGVGLTGSDPEKSFLFYNTCTTNSEGKCDILIFEPPQNNYEGETMMVSIQALSNEWKMYGYVFTDEFSKRYYNDGDQTFNNWHNNKQGGQYVELLVVPNDIMVMDPPDVEYKTLGVSSIHQDPPDALDDIEAIYLEYTMNVFLQRDTTIITQGKSVTHNSNFIMPLSGKYLRKISTIRTSTGEFSTYPILFMPVVIPAKFEKTKEVFIQTKEGYYTNQEPKRAYTVGSVSSLLPPIIAHADTSGVATIGHGCCKNHFRPDRPKTIYVPPEGYYVYYLSNSLKPDVIINDVKVYIISKGKVYSKNMKLDFGYYDDISGLLQKPADEYGIFTFDSDEEWVEVGDASNFETGANSGGSGTVLPPPAPPAVVDDPVITPPPPVGNVDVNHYYVVFKAADSLTNAPVNALFSGRKTIRFSNGAQMLAPYSGTFYGEGYGVETLLTTNDGAIGEATITVNVDAYGYKPKTQTVTYSLNSSTEGIDDVVVTIFLEEAPEEIIDYPPFPADSMTDHMGIDLFSPILNYVGPRYDINLMRLRDTLDLVDLTKKRRVHYVKTDNLTWDYYENAKSFALVSENNNELVIDPGDTIYPDVGEFRILLTGQEDKTKNGIYTGSIDYLQDADDETKNYYVYFLTRAVDMDDDYDLTDEMEVMVYQIPEGAKRKFISTKIAGIPKIDTSELVFEEVGVLSYVQQRQFFIDGDGVESSFDLGVSFNTRITNVAIYDMNTGDRICVNYTISTTHPYSVRLEFDDPPLSNEQFVVIVQSAVESS